MNLDAGKSHLHLRVPWGTGCFRWGGEKGFRIGDVQMDA